MKLEKAIEILDLNIREAGKKMPPDVLDALKLGAQALKAIKEYREMPFYGLLKLLPGEDPEPPTRRSLHHIKEVLESPLGREPRH